MAEMDSREKIVTAAVRDAALHIVNVALEHGTIRPEHAGRLQRKIFREALALWAQVEIVNKEPRQDESLGYVWMAESTN